MEEHMRPLAESVQLASSSSVSGRRQTGQPEENNYGVRRLFGKFKMRYNERATEAYTVSRCSFSTLVSISNFLPRIRPSSNRFRLLAMLDIHLAGLLRPDIRPQRKLYLSGEAQ
ncbi:unnamed protein product [Soboliphyme baturini]|uniref:Transposase n=1 Tax=Soboliphyme baturini TaxID=241478 RepID=A0A183IDR2_9BILA|nr:unnamed protein product [Soboliphyme baturini]